MNIKMLRKCIGIMINYDDNNYMYIDENEENVDDVIVDR